jgi:hypothetical protein
MPKCWICHIKDKETHPIWLVTGVWPYQRLESHYVCKECYDHRVQAIAKITDAKLKDGSITMAAQLIGKPLKPMVR